MFTRVFHILRGDTESFGCELLHVRVRGLIELIRIVVCIITYGDEERMELRGFRWRLVAAQRHSECLAAVCRERKRKLLCAQVEKERKKNKTGNIKTHHTHLCELKPQYTSVPVCHGGAGCSTHTCFLNRPGDGEVNDTVRQSSRS